MPYHLHETIVLKSGSLSLLEPSVPVQACNRDCFTFTFLMKSHLDYTTFVARRQKARVSLLVCRNTEMARRSITIRNSIAASCFSLSRPLFGVCQHLLASSIRSVALRLTGAFGSTYLCEEAFSQMEIIK